jgi:hypothetical protein
MHDVDVVHGDVKSRNLLVFYEEDDDEDAANTSDAGAAADGQQGEASAAAAAAGTSNKQQQQQQQQNGEREVVWALKWCDFGVSFRAAEAPDGILRTVSRLMLEYCAAYLRSLLRTCSMHRCASLLGASADLPLCDVVVLLKAVC